MTKRTTVAPYRWPYHEHRTLAQVEAERRMDAHQRITVAKQRESDLRFQSALKAGAT